jgi:hypothetical protein
MSAQTRKMLLVGDNPFHGISHLSQERARSRSESLELSVDNAADTVLAAVQNGAEGFMFSVSDLTLAILKALRERGSIDHLKLYAIVPYAFEYVRIATQTGTPGLAKRFAREIAISGDTRAILGGLGAIAKMDPQGLVKTYLAYEISRIRSSAGKKAKVDSIILCETVADMGLALNFDWLFKTFISYLNKRGITPGFNTRNLPYLVNKFNEWNIDLDQMVLVAPFNKAGFQMNPSREEFEKTLSTLSRSIVIGISMFAAGYLLPSEAVDYIAGLRNLKGVAAGVSKQEQAEETFALLRKRLN